MADETKPNPPAAPEQPKPSAEAPKAAVPAAAAKPAPSAPAKPAGPTPVPWESELTARLKKMYGSGIREANTYLGQNYLVVDRKILHDILSIMRHDEQFDYCVDVTAVHYPKKDLVFEMVYILYSFPMNTRVRVKAEIDEGEEVPTVTDLWRTADWLEREVFDMFGIRFAGHPNMKRILLPEDWKGYPLRKDYPILQQDKEWVQINIGIESGQ